MGKTQVGRLADYDGYVRTNANMVGMQQPTISVLGASAPNSTSINKSLIGGAPIQLNCASFRAVDNGSPGAQYAPTIVMLPVEGAVNSGSAVGDTPPLSTELLLQYLAGALDEDEMTPLYNQKQQQAYEDIALLASTSDQHGIDIINLTKATTKNDISIGLLIPVVNLNTQNISIHEVSIEDINIVLQEQAATLQALAEQNTALTLVVGKNSATLVTMNDAVNQNTEDIINLVSAMSVANGRINSNATGISANVESISALSASMNNVALGVSENAAAISQQETVLLAHSNYIEENTRNISGIYELLGVEATSAVITQEGYGSDQDEITLEGEWLKGPPDLEVMFSHGYTVEGSNSSDQEVVCGYGGLIIIPGTNQYKFILTTGLYEAAPVNDVPINFYPPTVSAAFPQGTIVYTNESAVFTSPSPFSLLRVGGSLNLANNGPGGVSGDFTMQVSIDGADWIDVSSMFAYFGEPSASGINSIIDKIFTFPQAVHSYKFRGKLVLLYAPYDDRVLEGSMAVSVVTESGTGTKLSGNVFAKWHAKE